jgi:hypothetical protein
MSSEKFAGRERRCTHWPVGNLCGPRLQASSKFQRDFALFAARRAMFGCETLEGASEMGAAHMFCLASITVSRMVCKTEPQSQTSA